MLFEFLRDNKISCNVYYNMFWTRYLVTQYPSYNVYKISPNAKSFIRCYNQYISLSNKKVYFV